MKDPKDKGTQDIEDLLKKTVGRPSKLSQPMKGSERAAARRERIRTLIEIGNPDHWDLQICREVLAYNKYEQYHEIAWRRFGQLKKYSYSNGNG